jgi:hypothetical protein
MVFGATIKGCIFIPLTICDNTTKHVNVLIRDVSVPVIGYLIVLVVISLSDILAVVNIAENGIQQ